MASVLIVDDLLSIHEMLEAVIQPTGFHTAFATDGEKALVRYKEEKFDLVLADIDMKPMDGITLLKHLKQYDPSAVVVIMTAYPSTESAIQALKLGAFDYLQKPFRVTELIETLKRGIEFKAFQTESSNKGLAPSGSVSSVEQRIIGQSPAITKLIQQIKKLATVRSPVLLQGENGTGKTAVAELLHDALGPESGPLIRIDCSLSSEANFREGLLGQNGAGGAWVERAKGGTLYLQHLQCLPMEVQQALVSVLRNTAHGFRLICTSAGDLEALVNEGSFHDELYYRVASFPVLIPPLRDRKEDIPMLIKHYAAQIANPHFDAKMVEFTEDGVALLTTYHWPGNLTELYQVVSKIVSASESRVITSQQLPLRLREMQHWPSLSEYLSGQEKQYIDLVLRACYGDKGEAAKVLGVEVRRIG
jgi:two-component system, NtrC family, response regulator HydG|uniref:sigma-54-dependent transcriptional regulator n=1 Tax=Cephaloticoccus sp. TaxID=1985742 RepID=UPI00404A2657